MDESELPDFNYSTTDGLIDEVCMKEDVYQFGSIFNPVLFSFVVVLSVFGNILVTVILIQYENLKALSNAFILNLAVSDLIFTIGLPFWSYYHVHGWTFGVLACNIVSFIFNVGFYSSGILLIMMTIHRYVAVLSPLSSIVSSKSPYSILVSVIIWFLSILAAIPALIFTDVKEQYCGYGSNYWKIWDYYQQNILFLVTLVIFAYCYVQILCRLLRPPTQRRRNKTLKLIFTLVVVFFVGWAPYNIVIFMMSLSLQNPTGGDSKTMNLYCENYIKHLDYAFNICRLVAFSHCCLNPVFYVFVGVKFKNHLRKMCKSCGQRRNSFPRNTRLTITSMTSGEELTL